MLRSALLTLLSLVVALLLWLPSGHLLFTRSLAHDRLVTAKGMSGEQLYLWADPGNRAQAIARMRGSNAEWDFMARTFFVLALANIALTDRSLEPQCLEVMDTILDETVSLERRRGQAHFLMPYARNGRFVAPEGRSLFVDGEIAMMMAARRAVAEREELRGPFTQRVETMRRQMGRSPVLAGESYPDECWTFCNSIALAAFQASDVLDGSEHGAFVGQWLATARERLVDRKTGLLVSSFHVDGTPMDGPEGSSIWTSSHFLRLVDPALGEDQYRRARRELGDFALGFGYAREWPASWRGPMDVDSGPVIPLLDISLGSSGQALLGATTFGDEGFARGLLASLRLGGFPVWREGRVRFCASNAVGDAVVLYALVQGPLWERLGRER